MDLYQAQDFMKKMHPGKKIDYEFDDKCHRIIEIVFTDGVPHEIHHVENHKVKVTVEGQEPMYMPIMPHRITTNWNAVKSYVNTKNETYRPTES